MYIKTCRGNRGSLGQKIHFIAHFYYELAIWNTQYTCLYLYIKSTFETLEYVDLEYTTLEIFTVY